jgi:predicted ATPase
MERLTDFKPLERVVLPELGELDCTGLILVVGPNSSGKSQFIKDLYHRVSGEFRQLVVAQQVDVKKPEYEPFLDCLKREGYIKTVIDQNGTEQIRPMISYTGIAPGTNQIPVTQAQQWHQSFVSPDTLTFGRNEFLYYFGRMTVTALFLDSRLSSTGEVGMFDYQEQPPQNDLHTLYINDNARAELLKELLTTFSKSVWPDSTRGTTLCLRVSDGEVSAEDRASPQKNRDFRKIGDEGDGLKCYVSTCIALLLGRRPLCLIDEPEMCLHPPQAYNLGRFIGRFGKSPDRATFVSTHSSHVLRGIIQTTGELQIVRLTRRGGQFQAHRVSAEILKTALLKPRVRAESILDGIFAQAVIIVEGDTDRMVYQSTWETLSENYQLDIHFVAVGGTGGIADTCQLYKTLEIPFAVISDLDVLINNESRDLNTIISSLTESVHSEELILRAKDLSAKLVNLPPTISAEDVQAMLYEAISSPMNWSNGDDKCLYNKLGKIRTGINRKRNIKKGINAQPPEIVNLLTSFLEDLKGLRLFVVPHGDVEDWLEDQKIEARDKTEWANTAANRIEQIGASEGDIWDFMKDIADFLQSEHDYRHPDIRAQLD